MPSFASLAIAGLFAVAPAEPAIDWQAPAECPDAAEVGARMSTLLRRQAGAGAQLAVRARVVRADGRYRLSLTLRSAHGQLERALAADSCVLLARAVALIAAVHLDPLRVAQRLAPPSRVGPPPTLPPEGGGAVPEPPGPGSGAGQAGLEGRRAAGQSGTESRSTGAGPSGAGGAGQAGAGEVPPVADAADGSATGAGEQVGGAPAGAPAGTPGAAGVERPVGGAAAPVEAAGPSVGGALAPAEAAGRPGGGALAPAFDGGTDELSPEPAPAASGRAPGERGGLLRVQTGVEYGVLPAVAAAPAGGGGAGGGGGGGGGGLAAGPGREVLAADATIGGRFSRLAAVVRACAVLRVPPGARLSLLGCLGGELGGLRAVATRGVTAPNPSWSPWGAVLVGPAARVSLVGPLGLWVGVEAVFALTRPTYTTGADAQTLLQPAPAGVRATLGLDLQIVARKRRARATD